MVATRAVEFLAPRDKNGCPKRRRHEDITYKNEENSCDFSVIEALRAIYPNSAQRI
jgi:hypothetical protein